MADYDRQMEKVDEILDWADSHSNFDSSFVEEMDETLKNGVILTRNQEFALDKIIEQWRIRD